MPEENIAQPQVVHAHPFRWKKVILTVLAISIVTSLIAVGLYWYLSQNDGKLIPYTGKQASKSASKSSSTVNTTKKDEKENWKTYLGERNGQKFSIKYPEDWKLSEKVVEVKYKLIDFVSGEDSLQIDTYGYGLDTTGDSVVINTQSGPMTVVIPLKDGVPVQKTPQTGIGLSSISKGVNQINFFIRFGESSSQERAKDWETLKEMLSSFKFL